MVMAGQFESLIDPFVIFSRCLLLFQGFARSLCLRHDLQHVQFIGIILQVGTGVNNGIVLVDTSTLCGRGAKIWSMPSGTAGDKDCVRS
jgi:multidrug efflux pump subunit AcrB